jgi:hypothetical protein
LLFTFLLLGAVANVIFMTMKIRVNSKRLDGEKFPWWVRDFRRVNQKYSEYYPNSILPDIDRYGGYFLYGLFAVVILAGLLQN